MAYTSIQFIGLEVDTTPGINPDEHYLGSHRGFKADINGRCRILQNAIAQAEPAASKRSDALKLFMAPEFFFRSRDGGYPIESVSSIMETMREYTKLSKFSDWIFVHGTAIGYLEASGKMEAFNIAMVQRGGVESTRGAATELIVYKEYVSHIDFIRDDSLDWSVLSERIARLGGGDHQVLATEGSRDVGSSRRAKTNAVGPGSEQTQSGLGGQGIFDMADVTFGLEVCLDHARGRLLASPPTSGQREIQVHLVPSAGMSLETKYSVCMPRGYFFNVDGIRPGADAMLRKSGKQYDRLPQSTTAPVTVPIDTYFNGSAQVRLFEPQPLPAPALVA